MTNSSPEDILFGRSAVPMARFRAIGQGLAFGSWHANMDRCQEENDDSIY
jgi:hypothetical protein